MAVFLRDCLQGWSGALMLCALYILYLFHRVSHGASPAEEELRRKQSLESALAERRQQREREAKEQARMKGLPDVTLLRQFHRQSERGL